MKQYFDIDGARWYYYLVPCENKDSLIGAIGSEEILNKFIVCLIIPRDGKKDARVFAAFDSYLDFLRYLRCFPMEKWFFFEVILGDQLQKLYFDIEIYPKDIPLLDGKVFSIELLSALVDGITLVFRERGYEIDISKNILLFSSSNKEKFSYHIIVDGYAVLNNRENATLFAKVLSKVPEKYHQFIDASMYSMKQQLRLYQSQKPGSGRPKIFIDRWWYKSSVVEYPYPTSDKRLHFSAVFGASCVTVIDNCQIISVLPEDPPPKHPVFDDGPIDEEIVKNIREQISSGILEAFSIYKTIDSLILLKRIKPAHCKLCNRRHDSENAYLRVSKSGKVFFYCRRNDSYNKVHGLRSCFLTVTNVYCPPKIDSSLFYAELTIELLPGIYTLHQEAKNMAATITLNDLRK